jgi:predicted phosphodiesterase
MKVKNRVVVFPDTHFPNHDEKAFKCALKVLEKIKPDIFLSLGDIVDGESVSHWQWKKKKRPPLEYQLPAIYKEIKNANKCLDRLDEILEKIGCKNKVLAQGNHDAWFDMFVEENPYLEDIGFLNAFRIRERGYEFYPYGELFKVGGSKLYAYHGGHYMGIVHTRSHVLNLGCNIIYGHVHDCQKSCVTHIDGPIMAHSMGCLTDMKKSYLKGRQTNWSHNVGIIDLFDDDNFNLQVLTITNGITSYNGKII